MCKCFIVTDGVAVNVVWYGGCVNGLFTSEENDGWLKSILGAVGLVGPTGFPIGVP